MQDFQVKEEIKEEEEEKSNNNEIENGERENQPFLDRKTKADINKEKRKKDYGVQQKHQRLKKKQKQDIDRFACIYTFFWLIFEHRIDEIVKELEHTDEILKERLMVREIAQKDNENRTKKLGRYKFEEPKKAVLLTEELPKNLRSLPVSKPPF